MFSVRMASTLKFFKSFKFKMKNCMNLNISCLYYAGFWPTSEECPVKQDVVNLLARVHLSRMVYSLCVQSYNIYLVWGDVGHMVEYTTLFVFDVKFLVDVYTLIYRHNEIAGIVRYLRDKQGSETRDREQRRIVSLVNKITHYSTLVLNIVMLNVLLCIAVVLAWYGLEHREIPFRKWYPFDVTYTPIFELTLFVVMFNQTYDMLLVTFFAGLFIAINIQLIGQFALLNYKLANMHELVAADMLRRRQLTERLARRQQKDQVQTKPLVQSLVMAGSRNKSLSRKEVLTLSKGANHHEVRRLKTILIDRDLATAKFLQSCVDHQNELVEQSKVFGSLFQTTYMTQVCNNALTGLATIYITNFSLNLDAKVVVEGAVIFAAVAEYAIFCALATVLLEYSCKVSLSAYSCNWFDMSRSVKKSLRIVMARAMKGISFSAFGVFPVIMESFVKVLKFSYSTYAVLDSVSSAYKETN